MTPRRLARWAFFAGWAYALVWSTLWEIFEWPTWFGALTALVGSTTAYWLIDWAADREESA